MCPIPTTSLQAKRISNVVNVKMYFSYIFHGFIDEVCVS